jgi:hypothetical protein
LDDEIEKEIDRLTKKELLKLPDNPTIKDYLSGINYYVRLYLDLFPDASDVLIAEFWKWIRGEWK